jgi:hypothetical protein
MSNKESNLSLAVVPQEFLTKMEQEIDELKSILREKTEDERKSEWIESVKIPKLLGISRKTWQTYRDRRMIPFSQIGAKIYVKRSDLETFMKAHYIDTIDSHKTDAKTKG